MEALITEIPEWVTKKFGVKAGDICKVMRTDDKYALGANKMCYLIETKTKKAVTVYSYEIQILKEN